VIEQATDDFTGDVRHRFFKLDVVAIFGMQKIRTNQQQNQIRRIEVIIDC